MQQSVATGQISDGRESEPDLIEQQAVRRAQNGDAAAFEYLYKVHGRRVYSVCLRMLRNREDAEDLTQQVFLQMFRKIGTFRSEGRVSTWLHRIAVNAVLMRWRRKRPAEVQINETDDGPAILSSPHPSQMSTVDWVSLVRAIRNLPRKSMRLFLLHHVMGYEHHEIASMVGCSIGTSKSQVHKACVRLRRMLEGHKESTLKIGLEDGAIASSGAEWMAPASSSLAT
jgi:RNA polymerase sigma-70 factor (ECF subfamily)